MKKLKTLSVRLNGKPVGILEQTKDGKLKITDIVSNQGSKKYINLVKNEATVNQEKIDNDAKWDGIHGVITNVADESCSQLLTRYRDLWKIEEAFRFNKHDLKLRPIYHWKPERVRAHITICYIAFALLSHAKIMLEESNVNISFEILRDELLKAQSSLVRDTKNKTLFSIPSKATELQNAIYKSFKLKRTQSTTILSMN